MRGFPDALLQGTGPSNRVRAVKEALGDARARARIDPGVQDLAHSGLARLRARLAEACSHERRMRYEWELRHLLDLSAGRRFPGTI